MLRYYVPQVVGKLFRKLILHRRSATKPARGFAPGEQSLTLFLPILSPSVFRREQIAREILQTCRKTRDSDESFKTARETKVGCNLRQKRYFCARKISEISNRVSKRMGRKTREFFDFVAARLRKYCILLLSADEECFDSPATDVPNEDGCVKTRQVDVNRAQTEFLFYHVRRSSTILKRALISRLFQTIKCQIKCSIMTNIIIFFFNKISLHYYELNYHIFYVISPLIK